MKHIENFLGYNIEEIRKIVRNMRILLSIYVLLFIGEVSYGTFLLYNSNNYFFIPYTVACIVIYVFIKEYSDYKLFNNIKRNYKNER